MLNIIKFLFNFKDSVYSFNLSRSQLFLISVLFISVFSLNFFVIFSLFESVFTLTKTVLKLKSELSFVIEKLAEAKP